MDGLTWNDLLGGFVVGVLVMLMIGGSKSTTSRRRRRSLLSLAIFGFVASAWSRNRLPRWDD